MESQVFFTAPERWDTERSHTFNKTGDNDKSGNGASLPAIIAAFVPSFVTAILFMVVFVLIRRHHQRIYAPRTYIDLIPEKDRTPSSGTARFAWIKALATLGDKFILEHSSLDAYLYLRFLRTAIFICFIGSCITWPILFPVNATGGGHASELDRLGFGNVHGHKRLYAHAVVAWLFFGFVMFLIARERLWLIGLRQAWYLSKTKASRLSSRTVLFLDPPKHASQNDDVQANFGDESKQQWAVIATHELDHLVGSRNSKALELESAEVTFLRNVNKKRSKLAKDNDSDNVEINIETIQSLRPVSKQYYVTGEGTDAINHLRDSLKETSHKVEESRESHLAHGNHTRFAIFVEYATQSAAQRAYRGRFKLGLPVPPNLAVQFRLIGVSPSEIIWDNLTMPQTARISEKSIANLLIAALIIFWSIPTAFIGTVSNVNYLADRVEWLHWIKNLPQPILGLLTGLLPPLLTSLLASYVPNIMRYVAKKSGEPTTVSAELQVQAWYYAFQLIQVFFVTALSSSATAFIPRIINQPHEVPTLLADNLPKSSNFYLTYFILQGLGSSARNILNYSDLFQYILWDMFVNQTPREKYNQYTNLKGISWGKLYPKFTNFVIIAIAYSCISPLVLGFATIGLSLFYLSYLHNFLFVVQPKLETKGKCYTRALQQILSGVYVGELSLIGLFSLRRATGPSIMTAVLFFGTIAYNVVMNRYLGPLEDHLPDDLMTAEEVEEEEPLLAAEEGEAVERAHDQSQVQRLGQRLHAPQQVIDPIARFFEPHIYASHKVMKAFLASHAFDLEPPEYSEEELRTAYMNPSLTSKTPTIWLPKDEAGLSKKEVEDNSAAGIKSTDERAWLDKKSRVVFDRDSLRELPVWKKSAEY
ncbi:uncharacterized protein BCR38DRAFT_437063 [Pseudomassariella vexata]|uniref:DUF221-domain-containing protein n=1 Tax=Pseudomassariella vexata TaxID=1141098 RepID=A0A1Y2DWL2_9PEZI|nr:uncharacterized protein BCR38DRAFT_437063 [Pseudomassariella vexata]ORY63526.1 hypothetical protein BCR38DRAFT_437063 [Pseudomassariella vexata]